MTRAGDFRGCILDDLPPAERVALATILVAAADVRSGNGQADNARAFTSFYQLVRAPDSRGRVEP